MFDDYGRPINVSNGNDSGNRSRSDQGGMKAAPKVVKAVPKVDVEEDVKGGVQKFRVKVLAEGYGQNDLDVLCQIGLDGIRMLDPATGRTLRIYPFETLTRWEVLDSYIFAFWAKMPVDIEPKRIRIKSSSYTTNTILDTVTAASVQLKEIGERKDSSSSKVSEQLAERKKGFDWMNLIKPANEEKDYWAEVTQRLTNSREAADRSGSLLSHEDLAKKLKEEMSRNSKSSAGLMSEGSQSRMRDVACPTCTVHLQVEVPASGSETIECSVCQHPFLVNTH
uniref:Uncharacterized protein n=1 Tax=Chenopodium quinoa TaxID=63459 RepID=A0A803KWC6_CHEQI